LRSESRKQKAEIWDLVLLGDGPLRAQLEALRSKLGIGQRLHFAGARLYSELPEFYSLAGAFSELLPVAELPGLFNALN
jgi:glycosyltransferase involved in cell wall biosynthesis